VVISFACHSGAGGNIIQSLNDEQLAGAAISFRWQFIAASRIIAACRIIAMNIQVQVAISFRNICEHSDAGVNIIQKHSGAGGNIIQKHSQQYQNIYDYAILALTITNRN